MDFEDIWDKIVDEFQYFISFEWFSDIGEFFSGLFENLGELSIGGLIFGLIGVYLTHIVLGKLDYISNQNAIGKILWSGIMYLFSFVLTYIMVKRTLNM